MDIEQISAELNHRFSELLPEFYRRRIIVWHDEEHEYSDCIEELRLDRAKVAILSETNNFVIKKQICYDDPESDYLLYVPVTFDSLEDNWLLDLMLYSEEFHTDQITSIMEELHIPQHVALRREIKQYRQFFRSKDRQKRFSALGNPPTNVPQLQLGIMAVLSSADKPKPDHIIRLVLQGGLDAEENPVYQEFCKFGIEPVFWRMVEQGTGFAHESGDLDAFAKHLLLTALTRTIHTDYLKGLEQYYSLPYQAYCYDHVTEWLHSRENDWLLDIAQKVEDDLELAQRLLRAQVQDLLETEIFPCVHEVILLKLMRSVEQEVIDSELIRETVEKRRTTVGYLAYDFYYSGLLALADMHTFFKEHSVGFHASVPREIWKKYTTEYYKMDAYYRRFHDAYEERNTDYHPDLTDLFHAVMKKAEALYAGWYLGGLGKNWSDACADDLRDYGYIMGVPKQTDFYRDRVASEKSRVFVIISDAMRYEVAVTLKEVLQREMQADVGISSMQAIFPTVTKFGMAALLPHKKLSVTLSGKESDRLSVLADGQSTEANYRDKLLKTANPESVALRYSDILEQPNKESRRALVKGMNVIYIYHDTIDAAGHDEKNVFSACEKAIAELKTLVRIITSDYGSTRILITADHGFLYTHEALKSTDKADKLTEPDAEIEVSRRYMIVKGHSAPDYLMQVHFLGDETGYSAWTPRESIRLRMNGSGMNFVHGGISLQEMVVPVIEYHSLRTQSKEYQRNRSKYDTMPVTLHLQSATRKVFNMVFALDFYQKEAAVGNRIGATFQIRFVDSTGRPVSDTVTLIADRRSEDVRERSFHCMFHLKQLKYSTTESYFLTITDEHGAELTREEFQIDIALAVEEFDFFS